jgi:pimeloyl-ACP methyl ester carboxylesterase
MDRSVAVELTTQTQEQTRARYPDESGYVERDGVKVFYEVYGEGDPTVLFVPPWSLVHSRCWKMQIPYFARHCRVLAFDPRGNGRSDRPVDAEAYGEYHYADDALAVLDETGTERAVVVTHSLGAQRSLLLAADHPERVTGIVFIAPALMIAPGPAHRDVYPFDEPLDTDEGWAKVNTYYWRRDFPGFVEFFFSQGFPEPHSTKPTEDTIGWGLETDGETLATLSRNRFIAQDEIRAVCKRVRCPVLVVSGDQDALTTHRRGVALANATGGTMVTLEGSGHFPHVRDPAKVNLLLHDFIRSHA